MKSKRNMFLPETAFMCADRDQLKVFQNLPELDCLNTETTCFKNTVNSSALFMLGFFAETSS